MWRTTHQRRRGGGFKMIPLLIAGIVIAWQFFSAEKFTNPETGQQVRVGMSTEQESALGLQSFQEVLSQSDVVETGPEVELVTRVARRLASVTGPAANNFEWAVSVVRNPAANAFCLPGGKIVVFTGILPVAETEAGLAVVMGHEMAHAVARHGSQRVLQHGMFQTAMMGAAFSMGEMDFRQRQMLLGLLGAGAQYGILMPFGREHETESDQMGLLYMARAGYDPREAIPFWQRMAAQSQGPQPAEFMSTHPSHGTRIQRLEEFMPRALQEFQATSRSY